MVCITRYNISGNTDPALYSFLITLAFLFGRKYDKI